MGTIHIIMLFVLFVMLVAIYFIAKEFNTESKISKEQDFIHVLLEKKEKHLKSIDSPVSLELYLKILLIAPLVSGVLIFILTKNELISTMIAVLSFLGPEAIVRIIKHDNDKKFEERYARSLEQLSSSLRAGLSIPQAVEDVANCKFLHESMRKKYSKLSSDLQMGISVAEAFKKFAEGTTSVDAHDIAIAIDVQNEVGGHEAEVIESISSNIQDRIMLRREVKSIFAGTTSMVWIMDFISPVIVLGFGLTNKSYVETYFSSPLYTVVFIVLIISMGIGSVINHKILSKVEKGK